MLPSRCAILTGDVAAHSAMADAFTPTEATAPAEIVAWRNWRRFMPGSLPLPTISTPPHSSTPLTCMALEQDRRITDVVTRERSRLRNFIRRRVPAPRDAEDILQDVFFELVEANRLLMPIEHATGWLFRVARNRITDLFRKKTPEPFGEAIEDLLPSPDADPDALYVRGALLETLEAAIGELP